MYNKLSIFEYYGEHIMRLGKTVSKNSTSLYVIKSTYENGLHSSKIVEKLGTESDLRKRLNGDDPYVWAENYIRELNKRDAVENAKITIEYSPHKSIDENQRKFNGGYLFLQKIYHELGIKNICFKLSEMYSFNYNLDAILSRLLYCRIIHPTSKLATFKFAQGLLEPADFELHDVYRALDVIAKESDFIQAEVYKNSLKYIKRNTKILFYDCTNFFFEIESEDGLKQYGLSKEHRPNPIVQMGLFMDGNGIPLTFSINPGNTNEQITLRPLEKKLIKDFKLSKFVVCTDAGLASTANRAFNNICDRAFVTTQSVKQLKSFLKEWVLNTNEWKSIVDNKLHDISNIGDVDDDIIYYKERWIKENNLEQRLIVTFSKKTQRYQRNIRNEQIERAVKLIKTKPKILKRNQTDYKRFILATNLTSGGEIADDTEFSIDENLIVYEAMYDGFYAVCTNLEGDAKEIIAINKRRWEIEESFRILKSEFKARPVFLIKDDRIKAHFVTCFLALLLYRALEQKMESKFTCKEIIETLKNMDFLKIKGEGYIPTYQKTAITNKLHEVFEFRTDTEFVTLGQLRKITSITKKMK